MKIYAKVGDSYQIVDETEDAECPEGFIEMQTSRPEGENSTDYTAQEGGTWAITQDTLNAKLTLTENAWRDEQMPIARNNVTALQFGETGIPGSEQQWKDYWLALRKWVDTNPDFPDSTKRAVAPS